MASTSGKAITGMPLAQGKRLKLASIDDIQFSDGYVPITVLRVNVEPAMDGEHIANYFNNFGVMLGINGTNAKYWSYQMFSYFHSNVAIRTDVSQKYGCWYIRFVNAEDASRALSVTKHELLGENVLVEPAENWLQGSCEASARHQILTRKTMLTHVSDGNGTQLQDLNYDCLESIFKHLPDADLCSVADTCVKFNELANDIAQQKLKEMKFNLNLKLDAETLTNIKMLPIFGRYLKKIRVQYYFFELNVHEYQIKSNYVHNLINTNCPNLEALNWPQDRAPSSLRFTNLKNLRYLKLMCGNKTAASAINKIDCLKTVEHLVVCNGLATKTFYQRMHPMHQLRKLHLIHIYRMNLWDFAIFDYLEEIKILGWCNNTEAGLIYLVKKLPKLKILEFDYGGYVLTENAYLKLVAICRERPDKQRLILRIFNGQISIPQSDEEENKKYVQFVAALRIP